MPFGFRSPPGYGSSCSCHPPSATPSNGGAGDISWKRNCRICRADPRVRAGRPRPAVLQKQTPTRASAADQGVRPTNALPVIIAETREDFRGKRSEPEEGSQKAQEKQVTSPWRDLPWEGAPRLFPPENQEPSMRTEWVAKRKDDRIRTQMHYAR